jgi:hypothetical protein
MRHVTFIILDNIWNMMKHYGVEHSTAQEGLSKNDETESFFVVNKERLISSAAQLILLAHKAFPLFLVSDHSLCLTVFNLYNENIQ